MSRKGSYKRYITLFLAVTTTITLALIFVRHSTIQRIQLAPPSSTGQLENSPNAHLSTDDINKIINKKITGEPNGILRRSGDEYERANATLLSLVRNQELRGIISAMKQIESTFNNKFNYPWTFINDEEFSERFKTQVSKYTNSKIYFEKISNDHWVEPSWIDPSLSSASNDKLMSENIQYSNKQSYHRMCRWNSGMFYNNEGLKNFKWYWRVEPKTNYFCNIDYDVFKYLEDHNKTYGFNINIYDSPQSVRSLWTTTLEFIKLHPNYLNENGAFSWLTNQNLKDRNDITNGYSTCHFWSNFEIGNMDFFRSKPYNEYFKHLDKSGGFFYERWGDAPVHAIGLGLFEDKSKIHWFRDIGYEHYPYFNCPDSPKCKRCVPGKFVGIPDLQKENCLQQWVKYEMVDDPYS